MKHSQFWQAQGLDNIKPAHVGDKWESYDTPKLVANLVGEDSIVDVGCGTGRLARAFKPEQYIGIDLNENAISLSRKKHPEYKFKILKKYSDVPRQDVMLLHSVALHVPDDEIKELCKRAQKRIILAETMLDTFTGNKNKPPKSVKANMAFHYARYSAGYKELLMDWKLIETFSMRDENTEKSLTYMIFEK